ncbi:GM14264 [Drosophila sechellia]|uniref:GM14264 n=1 Tax=Drosophila sechellia TaxID=7238 RepID=B4HVI3_DROSE|nr:GM14264 [Drosophila sechellia]
MQRCSELGKNLETWQLLLRFDRNNLKVKKGPNGHYLDSECRDELRKSIPAKSFEERMSRVAKSLKRLDEVNDIGSPEAKSQQDNEKQSELPAKNQAKRKVLANPSVVDLCSDEEDEKSVVRFLDKETLDAESVIFNSSLMVLDEELGEVNLKDYADHLDGKLDEASLRKRNLREEDNTSLNANKQTSIKEFLTPKKSKQDQTASFASRHCLKTYVRRPKISSNTSGESGGHKSSDLIVMVDQEFAAINEETREFFIIKNRKPKTPTDGEPNQSDIKKDVSNSVALIEKDDSPCDSLASLEINVQSKSHPEVASEIHGEAKKNINILIESPKKVGAKDIPLPKGILSTDQEAHKENNPNTGITPEVPPQSPINANRFRSDLVSIPENMIWVRTDLLQEQVDRAPDNELLKTAGPSDPSKALRTGEKRRLSPQPSGKQCNSHGQTKRTAVDGYNPTSVAASTCSPNIPKDAAPAFNYSYQVNSPPPPAAATSSSYPATVPYNASPVSTSQPSGLLPTPVLNGGYSRPISSTVINSRYPVDPRPANSYWCLPANPVVTPASTTPIYQSTRPPAPTTSSSYQRQNPVRAVWASNYQTILPKIPLLETPPPNIPGRPVPSAAINNAPTGCNPRTDLTNIMDMLEQVKMFAYGQEIRRLST